jgi:predicted metal-dependent hydrolase
MVVGEASGDLLASALLCGLKERASPQAIEAMGIGGPRLSEAGFQSWWPAEALAVNGYLEVLQAYPRLWRMRRDLIERMKTARPGIFLGVDAPDFNLGVEAALRSKSDWILRKLQDWHTRPIPGALEPTSDAPADAQTASNALSPLQIRALNRQARALFVQRLAQFEQQHACVPVRWSLTSARTRWGSCSPGGHVRLNWRLIHLPLPIVDYVIAHELAHLEELNHGPRFWLRVEALYPEWRRERKALRAYRLDQG